MREIKFRAWHKPFKDNDFGAGYKYGNNVISFHDMSPEKYELEQYTGLNDIHNVPIYEGDILKDTAINWVVGVVTYENGHYLCGAEYLSDCINCGIAGNIHENPELLEVEA